MEEGEGKKAKEKKKREREKAKAAAAKKKKSKKGNDHVPLLGDVEMDDLSEVSSVVGGLLIYLTRCVDLTSIPCFRID